MDSEQLKNKILHKEHFLNIFQAPTLIIAYPTSFNVFDEDIDENCLDPGPEDESNEVMDLKRNTRLTSKKRTPRTR